MLHTNWRDLKEWSNYGFQMSTSSDEVVKLYDAAITQMGNYLDDPALGGIEGCITKMLQADPNFVLAHVMKTGNELMSTGTSLKVNNQLGCDVYNLAALADKLPDGSWEKRHAQAVKYLAEGQIQLSIDIWEDIISEYPLDFLTLKYLHNLFIFTGESPRLRDTIARALPFWKPHMPHYGFLLGMHAFGLEETNFYDEAEKEARLALQINPRDAWAVHAVAHCKEMTGKTAEGIQHMSETENNWKSTFLGCHNYWHWGLYYIENGDYENALGLYDQQVVTRLNASPSTFGLTDAATTLYRLEMEGVNVGDRWRDVFEVARQHTEDNVWSYVDANVFISCVGAKEKETTERVLESMKDFARNGSGYNRQVTQELTIPICEAIRAYGDGDYGTAVELVKPLRYKIQNIGGSHAQRDIFNIFLIQSALRSKQSHHQKLARSLLIERKAFKGESPMTDRLMAKLLAEHDK